jgi:CheY-like chemotaxis protein
MASPPPGTILIIDDEPSIVRGLARLLQRDGYSVATAGNGRQALAQLQAQRFAMILSDLRMPELDGPAFYARLQQQYPALCQRVIFLTGDVDAADTRRFLAQCGQPWLAKPCRPAAGHSAGVGFCSTCTASAGRACIPRAERAALQEKPGPAPAESSTEWRGADLVCQERAIAVSGGHPEREVPGLFWKVVP